MMKLVKKLTNRSFYEIMAVILEASKNDAKPTEVFYSAGLSYMQYKYYTHALCVQGLLKCTKSDDRGYSIFNITEMGMIYLQIYNQMVELGEDILVKLDSHLPDKGTLVT